MIAQPVTVNLPETLYQRIRQTAQDTDRSLETVLLESLTLLFGESSTDSESLELSLLTLNDEQLWSVVRRRIPWVDSMRLRELMEMDRQFGLTTTERTELDALLEMVDRQMLVRSRALALLQQRGHDVRQYLSEGG